MLRLLALDMCCCPYRRGLGVSIPVSNFVGQCRVARVTQTSGRCLFAKMPLALRSLLLEMQQAVLQQIEIALCQSLEAAAASPGWGQIILV